MRKIGFIRLQYTLAKYIVKFLYLGLTVDCEVTKIHVMEEKHFNRRTFLKRAGVGLAGLAFTPEPGRANEREASLQEYTRLHEQLSEFVDKAYRLPHFEDGWGNYPERSASFSTRDNTSVSTVDGIRDAVLESIGRNTMERYIELSWRHTKIAECFRLLYELDCHGLVLAHLAQRGLYGNNEVLFDGKCWNRERIAGVVFSSRAGEFLPDGSIIDDSEVDQRIAVARLAHLYPSPKSAPQMIKSDLHELPGWSLPERQAAFREALDHPKIRTMLQNSTCSIAEAYSTIKTALLETGYIMTEHTPAVVEQILRARLQFMNEVFLSPDTQTYIGVVHSDFKVREAADEAVIMANGEQHNIDWMREVGYKCHLSAESENFFGSSHTTKQILRSIASSSGETCIFFDTHGRMNGDIEFNDTDEGVLSSVDMAEALLLRLRRTKDPTALREVKIILYTCSSADFMFRLRFELYRAYQEQPLMKQGQPIPVEDITLPTAVGLSQLGNVGFDNMFYYPYQLTSGSLKNTRQLTGEYLMRRIQSLGYPAGDLAFFTDTHGEAPYMMGSSDSEASTPQRPA